MSDHSTATTEPDVLLILARLPKRPAQLPSSRQRPRAFLRVQSVHHRSTGQAPVTAGRCQRRQHAAGGHEAGAVRFTLDGLTDVKSTTAVGTVNSGPLVIGAHFNATGSADYAFDGLLDEISITNGFLAPAELQPLAAVPVPTPFQIEQLVLQSTSSVSLTFESGEDFLYDIQHSPDLATGGWITVRSFVAGTTGAATTTVGQVPVPGGDRGFLRVISRPPAE